MITIKYIIQSKRKNAPIYVYLSSGRGRLFKPLNTQRELKKLHIKEPFS